MDNETGQEEISRREALGRSGSAVALPLVGARPPEDQSALAGKHFAHSVPPTLSEASKSLTDGVSKAGLQRYVAIMWKEAVRVKGKRSASALCLGEMIEWICIDEETGLSIINKSVAEQWRLILMARERSRALIDNMPPELLTIAEEINSTADVDLVQKLLSFGQDWRKACTYFTDLLTAKGIHVQSHYIYVPRFVDVIQAIFDEKNWLNIPLGELKKDFCANKGWLSAKRMHGENGSFQWDRMQRLMEPISRKDLQKMQQVEKELGLHNKPASALERQKRRQELLNSLHASDPGPQR